MAASDHQDSIFFGGVYEAIPGRLLVGPHTHAETFAAKPAGFRFSGVPLPAPAHRYVISCLLPASALPAPPSPTPPAQSSATASSRGTPPPEGDVTPPASPSPAGAAAAEKVGVGADLPSDPKAAVAQLGSKAAAFIAQMNARRQQQQKQQQSAAGSPGVTTGLPPAFSRSVEKARHRRGVAGGGDSAAFFPATGPPESVVRRLAQDNEALCRCVEDALGAGHFLQCAITRESLDDVLDVQEAVDFVKKALSASPLSAIYIYSQSGRNRASAVAMYYLQREQKLPLGEILPRMPTSTPQPSFLRSLISKDKLARGDGTASFNEAHYFPLYFTRRYPQKSVSVIKAAMDTCPGDIEGVDRLLHDEFIFTKGAAPASAEVPAPVNGSFNSRNIASVAAAASANDLSFGSFGAEEGGGPVSLGPLDEEIITTICKALQNASVPAGRDEVKESYVRHRRNRNRVLREFLARDGVQAAGKVDLGAFKTPSESPQRAAASRADAGGDGANAGGLMSLPTVGPK